MLPGKAEPLRTGSLVPTFRGMYLERFMFMIEGLSQLSSVRQRDAVMRELDWCAQRDVESLDFLRYKATLAVLKDLLGQGWRVLYRHQSIFLSRPDYSHGKDLQLDPMLIKAQIRESMKGERLSKLAAPSTRRFVAALESPGPPKRPISDLISDGPTLASQLRDLPAESTVDTLRSLISPYLQLIDGEERDVHTGHRLIDIWRYFRYLWAIPYLATPGRNLFYLVRDAARPCHPVVGIAALGNSIVQLADRDREIGWSVKGIEERLAQVDGEPVRGNHENQDAYARRLAKCMRVAIEAELALINRKGLANLRELRAPTVELLQRLAKIASDSERERRELLRSSEQNGRTLKKRESQHAWNADSDDPLYVRKRAQALADIVHALLQFKEAGLDQSPLAAIRRLLGNDDGRKALRVALHANKKTRIGTSMMDLIVCGAIPPYSELLGGKLVAMLMASPQVVLDYRLRYGQQSSEIASRLAGKSVVRSADLVFLGTTSLYHVGSSQYERIKVPTSNGNVVSYRRMGYTEGYGSLLLSGDTTALLREVVVKSEGMRRVNNVFGEGISPRLRQIRDGLVGLGIPANVVLKHACPRIIYGVELASNAMEVLRGEETQPAYHFDLENSEAETKRIVDFWLCRWLLSRARRLESLRKVNLFEKSHLLLSNELRTLDVESAHQKDEECAPNVVNN